MSQYLPYSKLKCLNKSEFDRFFVNVISEDNLDEYIWDVHLEYPDELHELHIDHLLVPDKLKLILICCQNIVVTLQINMT